MFSYDALESLCNERNVSVRQVSIATGVATSTLSNWKLGRYEPKADKIQRLAGYFNVEFERFLDHDSGTA